MLTLDFSIFPVLETERLILRQLINEDVDDVFFLRSNEDILRFIGKEPAKDKKEAADFISRINNSASQNEAILWGITLKETPEKLIGTICYWNIIKEHYRAEIGYVLHPDFWRQSFMKEAMLVVLEYGFNEMKLHSIEARIKAGNKPSASLLEATGFVQEGYLKEEYYFKNKFYDSIIYSRLQ